MKTNFKFLLLAIICSFTFIVACNDKKQKVITETYIVDAITNKEYEIESVNFAKTENPELVLKRGKTYKFTIKAYGHPFYIKTEVVVGKDKVYNNGVTNNGASESDLLFTVPNDAPDLLFYVCKFHKMMSGKLNIID
jgi:hypothetical protein